MEISIRLILLLTLLTATIVGPPAAATPPHGASPRVLLVISSHGRDDGKVQPGFEMDELAQAWLVFGANGIAADIASPQGGAAVADGYDPMKAYNRAFAADAQATGQLAASLRIADVDPARYAAIFIIGGKGAMFDLPFSQSLASLIGAIHNRGGIVGAVCHGPAVLARLRDAQGKPFVAGRRLTGFTDEEEALFGKRWVAEFPFQIESELRRLGADFSEAPFMLPHVAVDDRIVTGQNPYSVALAAEAVVRALGKIPAARTGWPDEQSMILLAANLDTAPAALTSALAADHAALDMPLIAIWGYYRTIEAAGDPARTAEGLRVMEAAQPWFADPQLAEAIVRVRATLAAPPR